MLLLEAVWNLVVRVATDETILPRYVLQLSAVLFCELVAYHFASVLLLRDISISQKQHLQLTGAALSGQKFDELTCWKGGIL